MKLAASLVVQIIALIDDSKIDDGAIWKVAGFVEGDSSVDDTGLQLVHAITLHPFAA
jgi:hypothetical protein